LPKFGHWVLDVCFIKVNNTHSLSFLNELWYFDRSNNFRQSFWMINASNSTCLVLHLVIKTFKIMVNCV
jgi:hypothetical protein